MRNGRIPPVGLDLILKIVITLTIATCIIFSLAVMSGWFSIPADAHSDWMAEGFNAELSNAE